MSCRTFALGLLAVAVAFSVSCTIPPMDHPGPSATIPGVHAGQTPDDVVKALGHPQARENGWWVENVWFDMEFHVWTYKRKGRVIFDRHMAVVTSEANEKQEGRTD
jgi:hypothetical protein